MEEKKMAVPHMVEFHKRKTGKITGVKKAEAFSEEKILLQTEEGRLLIRGEKLHVDSLDLEEGILTLEGQIDSLSYLTSGKRKQGGSRLRRMLGGH